MDYTKLTEGIEVYYTGDMANKPATGRIIKVSSDKFYPVFYDIELNDGETTRIVKSIFPGAFAGIGKRFWVMSEYKANKSELIRKYQNNPTFNTIVHWLVKLLYENTLTLEELKKALAIAELKFKERKRERT